MLLQIPDILSADELRQARAWLAEGEWTDGRATAGGQAAGVKRNLQLRADTPATQALQGLVLAALQRHPVWFSAAPPKRILPPMFNRYGGEANTYGTHGVKLPAGHLVLYPGTSVHRVEPVTRGERLASFFWVESLVRSDEQRRLLFDLDMTLMRLRERHGDDADTVRLTGTYHNLLRLWAET